MGHRRNGRKAGARSKHGAPSRHPGRGSRSRTEHADGPGLVVSAARGGRHRGRLVSALGRTRPGSWYPPIRLSGRPGRAGERPPGRGGVIRGRVQSDASLEGPKPVLRGPRADDHVERDQHRHDGRRAEESAAPKCGVSSLPQSPAPACIERGHRIAFGQREHPYETCAIHERRLANRIRRARERHGAANPPPAHPIRQDPARPRRARSASPPPRCRRSRTGTAACRSSGFSWWLSTSGCISPSFSASRSRPRASTGSRSSATARPACRWAARNRRALPVARERAGSHDPAVPVVVRSRGRLRLGHDRPPRRGDRVRAAREGRAPDRE